MEKHTSYLVTCKFYSVVNIGLENWPAVASCTILQLLDIKLFTLKVYEVCLNCWNTVASRNMYFGGCRISSNLYGNVQHHNFIYVV